MSEMRRIYACMYCNLFMERLKFGRCPHCDMYITGSELLTCKSKTQIQYVPTWWNPFTWGRRWEAASMQPNQKRQLVSKLRIVK